MKKSAPWRAYSNFYELKDERNSHIFIHEEKNKIVALKISQVAGEVVLKYIYLFEEYKGQKKAETGNFYLVENNQCRKELS